MITMALVAMVCYLGCQESGDPISIEPPDHAPALTKDDSVMANAYLVRDAAEAYAAANGGNYSMNLGDPLPDGRTLIDFLPEGKLLLNPYTGVASSPGDYAASTPGQVGYIAYLSDPPYGYQITAVGADGSEYLAMIVVNPNEP